MRIMVTGSSGHLGEALVRTLQATGHSVIGLDILVSKTTTHVGSVTDKAWVQSLMQGVDVVMHTATLHKPHVGSHDKAAFVDVNVQGTVALLEAAVVNKVQSFIFTSTTSAFGRALEPAPQAPAVWVTEAVRDAPKNIYGVTKSSAEGVCDLFHHEHRLPIIILRTSRFFVEDDDSVAVRTDYEGDNAKANEFLYRRVDVEDVVSAHLLAMARAEVLGFGRYIISATTPFQPNDLSDLTHDAPAVVQRYVPQYVDIYRRRNFRMFPSIGRVYVNEAARRDLGWTPRFDFATVVERLANAQSILSDLAISIGAKGYHSEPYKGDGPYYVP
ncbi:MAG: NAD(P)-dependent oxidoreductase [Myxococcota bacterium]